MIPHGVPKRRLGAAYKKYNFSKNENTSFHKNEIVYGQRMLDKNNSDYQRTKDWAMHRMRSKSKPIANGCIEWDGAKNKRGYGLITVTLTGSKTEVWYTHRLMFYLNRDAELGRDMYVRHSCGNPLCLNLGHLTTQTAKPKKATSVGRQRKFTDEQILAIKNETGTLSSVAEKYHTSVSYVSKLRRGIAKPLLTGIGDLI